MKILIIGASGMLARPVVEAFSKQDHELRLFSRNITPDLFNKQHEVVQGDVFNLEDLCAAMKGCEAVHINLSVKDEAGAVANIVQAARQENIKLVSTVSGCTVSEENRWYYMIDTKYRAEQAIMESEIPYMIFRAGWFFESLELMIRKGKANMIGNLKHPYHWMAAKDYASMLVKAYELDEARNKIFYALGKESFLMKDLLESYVSTMHPQVNKISNTPTGMLKFIAWISRNPDLKRVADMFAYFEKTKEKADASETYAMLGEPTTQFKDWLNETKIS